MGKIKAKLQHCTCSFYLPFEFYSLLEYLTISLGDNSQGTRDYDGLKAALQNVLIVKTQAVCAKRDKVTSIVGIFTDQAFSYGLQDL